MECRLQCNARNEIFTDVMGAPDPTGGVGMASCTIVPWMDRSVSDLITEVGKASVL